MKYHHKFALVSKDDYSRTYYADGKYVRLDFFAHMLRVAIYEDEDSLFPTFSVCPGTSEMPQDGRKRLSTEGLSRLKQDKDDEFKIDDVTIKVDLENFRISYFLGEKKIFADREILSYNFEGEMGKGSYHYLSREEDEHIYGLGDKTGPINKNKHSFKLETFDALGFSSLSSDPLYKQIPFYICHNSVYSYGIYYDTYSNGEINFGQEHNNYYEPYKYVHFEEEALVYYVIFGSVEEIVTHFAYLTGKSFYPPKWSFSYCGSTMAYTDADKPLDSFKEFFSKCKEYEIAPGGFYLSSGYTSIDGKRCVFNWNKEKFPDPKGFADDMGKRGIHLLPNVKPAFLTTHPFYEYIKKNGWFLHYEDGSPYVFPFWGGEGSYLDFTNPDAASFWSECVKKNLVDLGYSSIWNDNNEYDIHDEGVYAYGFGHPIKAKLIRPLFSLLMARASFEGVKNKNGYMAVTRSACAGFQRQAETWTGDNLTSFPDFKGNHKMAMTSALTGFAFIGQDIGGFAGEKPSEELFLRWIAYGLFTPRFTLHSWNPDGSSTMPWLYPSRKEEVKKLFAFRAKLLPYLYSEAINAVDDYHPMIYPLFLKYPSYDEESDMFFCGSSIIAAPIFEEGEKERECLLPEGRFYLKDKLVEGRLLIENEPGDLPIYFVKEGSIIPLEENGKTIFSLYPLESGEFSYTFHEETERKEHTSRLIKVKCLDTEIIVEGLKDEEEVKLIDYKKRLVRKINA